MFFKGYFFKVTLFLCWVAVRDRNTKWDFCTKKTLKDNQLDLTNSDCWSFRYLLNVFLLRTERTMDFAPISAMNISFNVHKVWACEYCIFVLHFEKCEPILLSTLINVGCKMEASGVLWAWTDPVVIGHICLQVIDSFLHDNYMTVEVIIHKKLQNLRWTLVN